MSINICINLIGFIHKIYDIKADDVSNPDKWQNVNGVIGKNLVNSNLNSNEYTIELSQIWLIIIIICLIILITCNIFIWVITHDKICTNNNYNNYYKQPYKKVNISSSTDEDLSELEQFAME